MALNFTQQPMGIMAAGNPIEYAVMATNATVQKLAVSLIDMDALFTTVAQWIIDLEPGSNSSFRFRVDDLTEDLLGYDLPDLQPSWLGSTFGNCLHRFQVKVDGLDGAGNQLPLEFNYSTIFRVLNAAFDEPGVPDLTPFLVEAGQRYFLTNSPHTKTVGLHETEYLHMLSLAVPTVQLAYQFYSGQQLGQSFTPSYTWAASQVGMRIGVGPGNLPVVGSNLINDTTTHYDVHPLVLSGTNLFTDGDNGTFEGGIAGITATSAAPVNQNATHAYAGQYSLSVSATSTDAVNYSGLWQNLTPLALQPNTQYRLSMRVYYNVNPAVVQIGYLRLALAGLADAQYTPTEFLVDTRQDPDGFVVLTLAFTTGTDTAGTVVVEQKGNFDKGVVTYFDNISIQALTMGPRLKRFELDRECHTDAVRLHFVNRLGVTDSFTFTGTARRKLYTSGSTFDKSLATHATATHRGIIEQQKTGRTEFTCTSGALRPEETLWLQELLTSPAVYMQQGSTLVPVILSNGEFQVLDRQQNIQRLSVKILLANTYQSQRN